MTTFEPTQDRPAETTYVLGVNVDVTNGSSKSLSDCKDLANQSAMPFKGQNS